MNKKYGLFDLGHGLHISLDPESYDAFFPNCFITQTSLGKIMPPRDENMEIWTLKWNYLTQLGENLVHGLNRGKMTEQFVMEEIQRINEDTWKNTITV